jgi:hypothetical protein
MLLIADLDMENGILKHNVALLTEMNHIFALH